MSSGKKWKRKSLCSFFTMTFHKNKFEFNNTLSVKYMMTCWWHYYGQWYSNRKTIKRSVVYWVEEFSCILFSVRVCAETPQRDNRCFGHRVNTAVTQKNNNIKIILFTYCKIYKSVFDQNIFYRILCKINIINYFYKHVHRTNDDLWSGKR